MKKYDKQPTLSMFKAETHGNEKDYKELFIGHYKNHHRKIKSLFHNGVFKPYVNQVDRKIASTILNGK